MHKPRLQLQTSFDIAHLQFLDKQGQATQPLPDFATPDWLTYCLRQMQLARMVDDRAVKLQRTGRLGTYPSTLGQEAIGIATGNALMAEDIYCPYYRETGAFLERGVLIEEILANWGGDERGQNFQHPRKDLPICVPIATQMLHAAGVAFALKYRHQQSNQPLQVAVASSGEGATSKGDFYEAMNLAGVWKLPMVFVVNNNQWAISVSRIAQTATQTIAQKAIAAGIPALQVDGNDIVAVAWAVRDAMQRARSGEGPALIEALSYRLCDHTTADDASRYRSAQELEQAWQWEPIKRLDSYLRAQDLWSDAKQQDMERELAQVMESALNNWESRTPEPATAIFDHLYAQLPAAFYEQYDQLRDEQAGAERE
ncbi:pyruvate dehydrogenase (acetyl-transferring) E1 component subunit alpha [Microbulbifer hydrolyticus]|uniref:Pyruvate dehydrogenase E1 component subunit alpha n=1 Tax=Microbulbifer hydrolyticus TaxID=48074 RepID=A0A6P1T7P3_9GAMM|nr:pyruvate dehydrogenase (acetyl-transferring) E1 component subunit alpha [Microbulbifer hydrolyticus]MBB5211737.1 pyruvate dehydrogenase E1 component alpha subunit [Microbulbifer hydrolyticus]QHQ37536.1 pyruvate dehydrogenase (acetyl-transferring) E1 component subunit alpha [Microbulbifer hydrolyticus]